MLSNETIEEGVELIQSVATRSLKTKNSDVTGNRFTSFVLIYFLDPLLLKSKIILFGLVYLTFLPLNVNGEGTNPLSPTVDDHAWLLVNRGAGSSGISGNDFAHFDNTLASQRLYIRIVNPAKECIFLQFNREATETGDFIFRIRRPDGTLVNIEQDGISLTHWTVSENNDEDNFSKISAGPESLVGSTGYQLPFYVPSSELTTAGEYYIEFRDADNSTGESHIQWWDITVADCDLHESIQGRIWSKFWSLTTESYTNPFNGKFWACVPDISNPGFVFVTTMDFRGAQFQPYHFTVFLNSEGPGVGSTVDEKRRSVMGQAVGSPEFEIFLNDPGEDICPATTPGSANKNATLKRCSENEYCFIVNVTRSGKIDILLDFEGSNNTYDGPGSADVILTGEITAGEINEDFCIPWDGKDGKGEIRSPLEIDHINVTVVYSQGVVHFPVYDAEANTNGFCVNIIRPTGTSSGNVYWDDRNIPDASGFSDPTIQLNGCSLDCNGSGSGCHRWSKSKYGNQNTINTWWNSVEQTIPYEPGNPGYLTVEINPEEICPNGSTNLIPIINQLPQGADFPTTFEWRWLKNGLLVSSGISPTDSLPVLFDQFMGDYSLQLIWDNGYCETIAEAAVLQGPIVEAGPDITVNCINDLPFYLSGSTIGGNADFGSWTILSQPLQADGSLSNSGLTMEPELVTFTTTYDGVYILELKSEDPDNDGPCTHNLDIRSITVANCPCLETPTISCPLDITLECDEDTTPANTGSAHGLDCESNPLAVSYTDIILGGDCPTVSIIKRTWLVIDENGEESCDQIIRLVDSKAPTIMCLSDITIFGASVFDLPSADPESVLSLDHCTPFVNVSHEGDEVIDGNGCPDEPLIVFRTYQAMDDCGNSNECVRQFTIINPDALAPPQISCPRDTVVDCSSSFGQNLSPYFLPEGYNWPGTVNVCGNLDTLWNDSPSQVDFNCGEITRTWLIRNKYNGLTASCIQTITLLDNEDPFFLDGAGNEIKSDALFPIFIDTLQCGINLDDYMPVAMDNCDIEVDISILDEYNTQNPSFSCSKYNYKVFRTIQAIDDCDNTISGSYEIQLIDTISPEFTNFYPGYSIEKVGDNNEQFPIADFDYFELNDTVSVYPASGNCDPILILSPTLDDCNAPGDIYTSYDLHLYNPIQNVFEYQNTGAFSSSPLHIPDLLQGSLYKMILIAEDACGNKSQLIAFLETKRSTPVALCDEVIVSLDEDGYTQVPATILNQGSFDECFCPPGNCEYIVNGVPGPGQLLMQTRRENGNWEGYVAFSCYDIGIQHFVELRVTNEVGESNLCLVEITVLPGASGYNLQGEIIDASSSANADGSIKVTPQSPFDSFDFEWSNNLTDNEVPFSLNDSLHFGQYSVTVTETEYGCIEIGNYIVGAPHELILAGGSKFGSSGEIISLPFSVEKFQDVDTFSLAISLQNTIGEFVDISFHPGIEQGIDPLPTMGPGVNQFTLNFSDDNGLSLMDGEILFNVDIKLSADPLFIGLESDVPVLQHAFYNISQQLIPSSSAPGHIRIIEGNPTVTGRITTAGDNMKGVANVQIFDGIGGTQISSSPEGMYDFTFPYNAQPIIDPDIILDSDNDWYTGWDIGDPFLIKSYLIGQWPSTWGPGPTLVS